MALRHDRISPEDVSRQDELDRSWSAAQEALADSEFRQDLEAAIERVNASRQTETTTREEFLQRTESTSS